MKALLRLALTFSPFGNQLEPGFRRNGRTFFVKMAYLFRRSCGG